MTRLTRWIPLVIGAVAGAVIALVVAGGGGSTHSTTTTTTVVRDQSGLPTSFSQTKGLSINQIYKAASPGVVDISVSTTTQGFFGSQQSGGEGSGVVYDTKGDILTDEHVVAGANSVSVRFQNGRSAPAKVLGTDPSTDVAVIRVNVPASELNPIPLADSSAAQVGDPVVAIGSPFGLPETTTTGIVSAVGRSITAPNNYTITNAIQTDAAINPGNSGGPLLDANGHVLGLNDQIQTNSGSNAGVGFAVPSNTVRRIADGIIAGHPVKHAYVGVSLQQSSTGGARISTGPDAQGNPPVVPGSPAARAGLQPGDVVTAINGKKISSTEQFIATVDSFSPGDTVTFTIERGGKSHDVQVTLGARPQRAPTG